MSDGRSNDEFRIQIPRQQLMAFLTLVVGVLLVNHLMLQWLYYRWDAGHWLLRDLFDVDEEENFPTWYASASLLFTSALLYAIALRTRRRQGPMLFQWRLLSFGFLLLSLDEVAGMHESINTVTDFPWTIPAAVLVAALSVPFLRFLWRLPRTTAVRFVTAGAVYVGGALGVEHLTDSYLETYDMDTLGYQLLTACEEGMEMAGVLIFINALLLYMTRDTTVAVGVSVEQSADRCGA